jgi:hypothetical protein
MPPGCHRSRLFGSLLALAVSAAPAAADPSPQQIEFFEKKVRPVLADNCLKCHGMGKKKGSLSLESRAGLLQGGDNGPVIVPGKPQQSRLIEAVGYKNVELRMPPRGKLPEAAIRDLTAWVQMGAPWPVLDAARTAAGKGGFDLYKRKREHWAWCPVRAPEVPAVKDASWPLDDVDRFILARLEEKGLAPAAAADRRTWLRRVSFDLIGLPPTPREIDAFLKDTSEEAAARVVDRLLASPHFGERWARHWLDLVRYAESRGHEYDYNLPNAWQYRDYVIRAFNADVPYDQFVVEHLAGDLLEEPRRHPTALFNESVLGTGFWFLGEELHSPVDVALDEADRFDNRLDVMGKTFLGLTVACARCHDHKFDAISTRDYYSLYGFLQSGSYRQVRFDTCEQERRLAGELARLRRRGQTAVGKALADGARPAADRLADYLLAAAEVVAAGSDSARRQTEIARGRNLDPGRLGHWATHLLAAAKDAEDPFHAFALAAAAGKGVPLAQTLRPLADGWRRRQAEAAAALKGAQTVIDYGRSGPQDWITDGGLFGAGPVRPGELRVWGKPERPEVRIATRGAAEVDRAWPALKRATGTENEPGALGFMVREGRALRTPSFQVGSGKVFYLVRGSGVAFACMHSHVMIAGPLHGNLIQGIKADSWQWVGHDLSRYKGGRGHVEFVPADGADFAVALVVQADAPPLIEPPDPSLLELVTGHAASPDDLAHGYQRSFKELIDRLAEGRLEAADARRADWLLRHRDLFDAGAAVDRAAAKVLAQQARLLARLRTESRLALAVLDGSGSDGRVFIRGNARNPGEVVPRRFLEALAGPAPLSIAHGSGRLKLARQMTDPQRNPLISRVLVNRVWHHLFGRGIVASVDNFGVLGERPTHPELLDHLADRFVRGGWSVKALIRALVLSRTYRMSCRADSAAAAADPRNLLLHHMPLRRLEGEAIRDALLSVSGRLNETLYGPPVPLYLNEFQTGRGRPDNGPLDGQGRRSVYLSVRRNFLSSLLLAFDTPIPFSTVGRRSVSNVPAQALILMNDPFIHEQAEAWARRCLAEGGTPQERLQRMYIAAFGRPAHEDECRRCMEFVEAQGGTPAAWTALAHALVNTKEFLYLH